MTHPSWNDSYAAPEPPPWDTGEPDPMLVEMVESKVIVPGPTLDVGCGTGWPVTSGLVDPVRYVGIDPSTAMLNALVAKHPVVAGIHPMSWAAAQEKRVLCGTRFDSVLSLSGSASYLSPAELRELAARGKRGAVVMHFVDAEESITNDVDPQIAAASLTAATQMASRQLRVGRFVVSHLPES